MTVILIVFLRSKITEIFEHLAAYRIKRRMVDGIALKLHLTTKWVADRVNVLDDAHAQFQLAVQEYRVCFSRDWRAFSFHPKDPRLYDLFK